MDRNKYDDLKDEDNQFNLDEYAKSTHQEEDLRIPCYAIPHLWGKDNICLHCGYSIEEAYGIKKSDPPTQSPLHKGRWQTLKGIIK